MQNRKITLVARPRGLPVADDFEMAVETLPALSAGQLLIRHDTIGLSPSARLRMSTGDSYSQPLALGDVVYGQAVGVVLESRHTDFKAGDAVMVAAAGWQEYSISRGVRVHAIDTGRARASLWLGVLGASGMTAWFGLLEIGRPAPGETVVVSAAAGGVGAIAGQIARLKGCRVVGIAGGAAKCDYVAGTLGFAACVNYKSPDFIEQLKAACPDGVDVYFDNVGGGVRDAVWPLLNDFGRVVVCGLISEYNADNASLLAGPAWFGILSKRLTVRGFILSDHLDRRDVFIAEMSDWLNRAQILVKEDITVGLENTPSAFIGMLEGKNFGKALVELQHSSKVAFSRTEFLRRE